MTLCFTASSEERLDVFLAAALGVERLHAREWIVAGCVQIADHSLKPSLRLWPGAIVSFTPPPPRPSEVEPQDLGVPVVYADMALVVINKPVGMATHPGPGWWKGSAVNALLFQIPHWPGVGGVAQPGIVHRLDRDTSGLLVFAKHDEAHQHLLDQASSRQMTRRYLAWVEGELHGEGLIDAPLGRSPEQPDRVIVTPAGKSARTRYRSLRGEEGRSLLELELETGRTHQIRVHLSHLGHPVLGDPWYHPRPGTEPMALHAYSLAFTHPSNGEALSFAASPPPAWRAFGPLLEIKDGLTRE